jgi:serpin B
VLCALAMTANGAAGETLTQMESVFGMSMEEINHYLYSYMKSLPEGDKYKLSLANSIWFTEDERFTVKRELLQKNADYYGADVYKAPFDETTLKDINHWVNDKTDGMIPKILDYIQPKAVMYLINALAFEAEWVKVYEKHQVKDGKFTKEDGTKQDVEFMYSLESCYLEDEKASGFIKYYAGQKYAFAAILPSEGISISEYIASLDGNSLKTLLTNVQNMSLKVAIPKFETEYAVEISKTLSDLGMSDAFSPEEANFKNLGTSTEGNLYISNVFHKTYISVGEKGTKAGAATAVVMEPTSGGPDFEPKQIYLDRPFVYMLIDCENNIPFFIGTMMDINQ